MAHDYVETKVTLVLAAGELFAKHGLEGASVRTIAEKAGVNIAAINYHFGSKENLYKAALEYAARRGEPALDRPIEQDERFYSATGQAELLMEIIREKFNTYFSMNSPRWCGTLVMRSMLEPSPALQSVVEEIFVPHHKRLKKLILQVKPHLGDEEVDLWALDLTGRISVFVTARVPILMVLGKEEFDKEFLTKAQEQVIETSLASLGLPDPRGKASIVIERRELDTADVSSADEEED